MANEGVVAAGVVAKSVGSGEDVVPALVRNGVSVVAESVVSVCTVVSAGTVASVLV